MYVRFGFFFVILSCCAGQDLDEADLFDIDESRGSGSRELYNRTSNNRITKRIRLVDDLDVAPTPPSRKKSTKPSGQASQQYWTPYSTRATGPPSMSEFSTIDIPEPPEVDTRADSEMEPLTKLEDGLDPADSYNVTNDLRRTERPQAPQLRAASKEDETFTYPFAVSVQKMGSHYASGALVDHRWVLTAAEVFFNVRESIKIYRMRLGSVDCKKGGSFIPLKRIEIHPSYVVGKPSYDVALIQLGVPVTSELSDTIKPIEFSEEKEKVANAKFLSIYWARLVVKGEVLPYTAKEREKFHSMRVSTQRVVPWDKCYRIMDLLKVALSESTLCLKPVSSHHSGCLPDVGAPVVGNDGLWGITSGWVSPNCHQVSSPVMVTRIASPLVRNWLDTTMAAH